MPCMRQALWNSRALPCSTAGFELQCHGSSGGATVVEGVHYNLWGTYYVSLHSGEGTSNRRPCPFVQWTLRSHRCRSLSAAYVAHERTSTKLAVAAQLHTLEPDSTRGDTFTHPLGTAVQSWSSNRDRNLDGLPPLLGASYLVLLLWRRRSALLNTTGAMPEAVDARAPLVA
jgi:hypothetical protein